MPNRHPHYFGRILVLGRDIRAFLTIARSLGRAGLQVHAGMCPKDDLALKSRYITKRHKIPDYSPNNGVWLHAMLELIEEYNFDLVIPTNDESVIPVQIHKDVLLTKCPVYALEDNAFRVSMDKIASSMLAEKLDLPVPKQWKIRMEDPDFSLPEDLSYPIVAKPPSSFTLDDLNNRREVLHIASEAAFKRFLHSHQAWGTALVQENFPGVGTGIEVLAKEGLILSAFQHLRLHEPIDGGASSYRKSVPLNSEMLDATARLLTEINYSGVVMVEYKIDPATGRWVFIEINARFWGSLPLAVAAGADFPLFLYQLITEGTQVFPQKYRNNIYSRNLLRDLYWLKDNFKARIRKEHASTTISMARVATEVFNILSFKEHIDSFSLDDPRPGFSEFKIILSLMTSKLVTMLKERWLILPPVRKFYAHRIKKKFRGARSILFICYGNICRSPFAERCAKELLGDGKSFLSSGFHTVGGRASPDLAQVIASEFNVSLTGHRSSVISKLLVNNTDLILVFDQKNHDAFLKGFPNAVCKLHFMAHLLKRGPLEIEDPYGENSIKYRKVYTQIEESIRNITSGNLN